MDAGILNLLIRTTMHCVSSSSLQVLRNKALTEEFRPSRGIHQGDPLSSYLFVLCMERLSHLIEKSFEQRKWKPLRLSMGPLLTHLFFADDLLLFGEAV